MRISAIKSSVLVAYYALILSGFVVFGFVTYMAIIRNESLPLILFFAVMTLFSLYATIWDRYKGLGSQYFLIDSYGVSYVKGRNTRFTIPWTSVAVIALVPDGYGRYSRKSFIVFATREDALLLLSNRDRYSEDVIGVQYRKGLTGLVGQYTDLPIRFINSIEP